MHKIHKGEDAMNMKREDEVESGQVIEIIRGRLRTIAQNGGFHSTEEGRAAHRAGLWTTQEEEVLSEILRKLGY